MSSFKSTVYGFYKYTNGNLFADAEFPEGIDTDVLIDNILLRCGEMCPIWTDPAFMRDMIGIWSKKWSRTFERWLIAYNKEYDPLYNYDRHEEIEDTNSAENSGEDSSTVTNTRSAYDSSAYEPHDQSEVSGETSSSTSGEYSREAHMYGNIGVTTSQQMLEAEYQISAWNIYEAITDLFMQEFCIMIY